MQSAGPFQGTSIQGLNIAYREAGDPTNPTIVLLHGFPTSGHMFRDLIPLIADKWHVIVLDYPGFGASDMPLVENFEWSSSMTTAPTLPNTPNGRRSFANTNRKRC